jgi:hypothetical protein
MEYESNAFSTLDDVDDDNKQDLAWIFPFQCPAFLGMSENDKQEAKKKVKTTMTRDEIIFSNNKSNFANHHR